MKLMSDLIAYLRDLLVFQVKPEAVAEDLNPELRSALEEQSAAIETDRLLELIDQFAGAEGRMKWAPNKRLHFEVAVIKAIQTLAQVTLNDVIADLSALREGQPAGNPPPAKKPAAKPVAAAKPAASKLPAISAAPPAAAPKAPRVEEKPAAEEAPAALEPAELWEKVVAQVRLRRPLIQSWVASSKLLAQEGRALLIGFPPEEKSAMDSLATPKMRDFLEALVKEISGRDWSLKFSLKEGLVVAAPPAAPEPPPVEKPKSPAENSATFKDDPLIREALEIFKGEIKPVTD